MLAKNPHRYKKGSDGLHHVPELNLKYDVDEPNNIIQFKEII